MKMLVIGDKERFQKCTAIYGSSERLKLTFLPRGATNAEIVAAEPEAEFILADAIQPIDGALIHAQKRLQVIHSEGVSFDAIDLEAARKRSITVCNCMGANASAVAEQTVLLMLACLRDVINLDAAVREGRQIQTKEQLMLKGVKELGDCKVGFIGAGQTAQATMKRLASWGCVMAYNKRTRLPLVEEKQLDTHYTDLDYLLASSDIVSIHAPLTDKTRNMVNEKFLSAMKEGAILINTSRGEIVDSQALADALASGHLSAAGLDTIYPEPVMPDNVLLNLPEEISRKIILSPHIAGITRSSFYRAYQVIIENMYNFMGKKELRNIVS